MHFNTAHLPDSLMNKGALKTTIIVGSQRFNVWNVHLQDGCSGRVRTRQIAELIKWVHEADDGQAADIVGGDFNFTPGTREFDQLVASIGPSVHELSGETVLPTWDGLSAKPGAGEALDHIFIRMREPVEEVHARPRRIFTAARIEDRLSDHMGMEARLTFGTATTVAEPILTESATAAWLEASALMHQ
jgi:endonuclease/exonuclease/phosphatase family metal-dependent hydrolase